jgi:hypothetical protein
MRGSVDLKLRPAGPDWRAPYRLAYFTGETLPGGRQSRIVGWGNTVEEAIQNLCTDPRAYAFDDLAGYLRRTIDPRPPVGVFIPSAEERRPAYEELPLEVGTKRGELLSAVPDPQNLFALVQWWPRGEQIKFRAEAMAPEPDHVARYESDLEMYHATNIVRITKPVRPIPRIIEFCVPAALVTAEVRFFYRTRDAFYFFRENNPYTSLDAYDFDIPIEGVTMLL